MLFRLAEMEGTTDVDGLARRLPYRKFQEWTAYHRISPIGGLRVEIAVATLAMIVANALSSSDGPRYELSDLLFFYPFNEKHERIKTPEEIQAALTMYLGPPTIVNQE